MAEKDVSSKSGSGILSCPGSEGVKCPTIEMVACNGCGAENEMFSDEDSVICDSCKEIVSR